MFSDAENGRQSLAYRLSILTRAGLTALLTHMDNHYDSYFHALADPTRRAVVARLAQGPAAVSELHAPHAMALPTFLKHLKVLESSGLVRSEKKGRVRTVHIEALPLAEAENWISQQRQIWSRRLDRLQTLAEQSPSPTKEPSP